MKADHSILRLCENLQVSTSGYYDWQRRRVTPSPRAQETQELAQEVEVIHGQSRQTYGSPRIVAALRSQGRRHGRARIARLMKAQGLCGRQKGRYRVRTTDSHHDHPIAPYRLAEAPEATAPNQIWVADITYIQTHEGWLYLAAILDLYSRRIVGWAMGQRIDTALVLRALGMALLHRQSPANLAVPFRSGGSIRGGPVSHGLGPSGPDRVHEPPRQLLRQRRHGKLLEHPQTRARLPAHCLPPTARPEPKSSTTSKRSITASASTAPLNYLSPVAFELKTN